ncbi:MAG: hypothetical protein NTV51_03040 [Verrucomicrobia bacterium]|nr:hypothetical protein [Verrucomicrobiota bacterium]
MTALVSTAVPELQARAALSAGERDAMFALLAEHFEGVTRDQFERDLAEKNWVVRLHHGDRLVGFTTLLVGESVFDGRTLTAIYSGDTIVAPEAWGSPALARAWIASVNHLRATLPPRPCYWLLLTSGFRTYRFLPVFWQQFFPHHARSTPPATQRLLDHLAGERYGGAFDRASGVVRFPHPQSLRATLASVPAGRIADPHVAFFLRRNPLHAAGEELVCLTEIHEGNLTAAGRRMVGAPAP